MGTGSSHAFRGFTDFARAEAAFDAVQKLDPFRLDDVDVYSNMLYVMPKLSKLAQLAKEYCDIDRNRAETCCLIGGSLLPLHLSPPSLPFFLKLSLITSPPPRPQETSTPHEANTPKPFSTSNDPSNSTETTFLLGR